MGTTKQSVSTMSTRLACPADREVVKDEHELKTDFNG